jgi:cell division septum initiation protein DivIVA
MSAEPHVVDEAARPGSALEAVLADDRLDERRPNVAGDLPSVFRAAPMFRRSVGGYDRFQVDTYVQWAEEELVTAEREREHLLAAHSRTWAELEQARALLSHSPDGGEMLRLSPRIASILASAADEATSMRTEADADRTAAAAHAEQVRADAEAAAERLVDAATGQADALIAEADRLVAEAELTRRRARVEAESRLDSVRQLEQRAAEQAEHIRQLALAEASAARLHAREEIVRMLGTGREERRRADAEAVATRLRLDREAAARSASLRAEVARLERRRTTLRAEVELLAGQAAQPARTGLDLHLQGLLARFGWRSRTLRVP